MRRPPFASCVPRDISARYCYIPRTNMRRCNCRKRTPSETHRDRNAPPIRKDRSYVITGGLGGLGLAVARWLAQQRGLEHIGLVARRQPNELEQSAMRDIAASGVAIEVVQADVEVSEELTAALMRIARNRVPSGGRISFGRSTRRWTDPAPIARAVREGTRSESTRCLEPASWPRKAMIWTISCCSRRCRRSWARPVKSITLQPMRFSTAWPAIATHTDCLH